MTVYCIRTIVYRITDNHVTKPLIPFFKYRDLERLHMHVTASGFLRSRPTATPFLKYFGKP